MVRLAFFYFILYSSFSIALSFFPVFLESNHLGKDQIGYIMAIGSVVAIIGQPFWGYWSDKLQSTKKMLLTVMIFSFFISFFLYSAATFVGLFLLFALFNFFKSSCGPLAENLGVQYATTHNKNYGAIRMWGAIGVGTGSLVFGYVMNWVGIGRIGWVYASVILLALPFIYLVTDYRNPKQVVKINLSSIMTLLRNKEYIWVLFICFVVMITHKMNDSLLAIYLTSMGAPISHVGMAWMIATFSSVPAFALTGILLKRFHELPIMAIAALLYSLRWSIITLVEDPQLLIALQLLHGITFPVFFISALAYVTRLVPKELIATGHTIFIAVAMGMTGLVGSSGGGWIMEQFNPQAAYQTGSIVTLGGAVLVILTIVYMRRNKMS